MQNDQGRAALLKKQRNQTACLRYAFFGALVLVVTVVYLLAFDSLSAFRTNSLSLTDTFVNLLPNFEFSGASTSNNQSSPDGSQLSTTSSKTKDLLSNSPTLASKKPAKEGKSVLFLVQATGRYIQLAILLIESGRRYFCHSGCSNVSYLLFTDANETTLESVMHPNISSPGHEQTVIKVFQPRLGWPDDSQKRFHIYVKQEAIIQKFDFVMSLDADLRFVNEVNVSDLYEDLVGVLHPSYYLADPHNGGGYSYERSHAESQAYIGPGACKECYYFTGAIWGGRPANFTAALRRLIWQLEEDVKNLGPKFTAEWQDESHLNRYFVDHPPSLRLLPSFYYPEDPGYINDPNLPKKIMSVRKDAGKLRQP